MFKHSFNKGLCGKKHAVFVHLKMDLFYLFLKDSIARHKILGLNFCEFIEK